jgi:putative acetyltransferase
MEGPVVDGRHDVALPVGTLRPVEDDDRDALIALVGAAYDEHPGCVLDLPGVDADLCAPATTAATRDGPWWVVTDGDEVVASVGAGPLQGSSIELKRLYVAASHRRRGLAEVLVGVVERHAAALGASTVELWSDSRFAAAHRLYGRLGYLDSGQRRELHDPSETTEHRFVRRLP